MQCYFVGSHVQSKIESIIQSIVQSTPQSSLESRVQVLYLPPHQKVNPTLVGFHCRLYQQLTSFDNCYIGEQLPCEWPHVRRSKIMTTIPTRYNTCIKIQGVIISCFSSKKLSEYNAQEWVVENTNWHQTAMCSCMLFKVAFTFDELPTWTRT